MLGVRVLHIDRERHHITTGDGRRIEYEHLVLATGARNRLLPGWDSATSGLMTLRTLHDAHGLREALNRSKRAVIVGAGFLGLEFAAVAAKRGVSVSVIEASSNLMSRAVSAPVADAFREHHESLGIDLHPWQRRQAHLHGSGSRDRCRDDGRRIARS